MMYPRLHILALSALVVFTLCTAGASGVSAQGPTDSIELRRNVLSPLEYIASNTGIFGHEPSGRGPGLFFPRASGQSYLFGSGLWFGARKGSRDRQPLVFYTFNVNTGRSEAAPGELLTVDDPAPPHLYHSVDYNLSSGLYQQSSTPLPPWPLWKDLSVDNEAATMFSPGLYEPMHHRRYRGYEGRVPAFARNAQEQMVMRYHDGDLKRYEIDSTQAGYLGYPIGLQIEQSIFGWELESLNQHVVVLRYQIINRSGDTLYDCVASQAAEPDLGKHSNDHVSFYHSRPDLRAGYFWSEPEYGAASHSLAMILVEAPVTGTDGFLDNSLRREFRSSGRVGAFPRWTAEPMQDPVTGVERYRLMTEGGFASEQGPEDYRGLLASTRFSMRPGDTAHVAIAFAIVGGIPDEIQATGNAEIICHGYEQELDRVVGELMQTYYAVSNVTGVVDERRGAGRGEMVLLPNPAHSATTIEFDVASPGEVRTQVSNSRGEVVLTSEGRIERAGRYRAELDISQLSSGLYVVTILTGGIASSAPLVITR